MAGKADYDCGLEQAVRLLVGDPKDADRAHSELLICHADDPSSVDVLFWLAESFCTYQYDPAAAVSLLRHALTLDPQRADCKSLLVGALVDLDHPAHELIPLVREVIDAVPDWVIPRQQLVMLYTQVGKRELADREASAMLDLMCSYYKSGLYKEYSYYEACVTGRHARPGADRDFLNSLKLLRRLR